MPGVSRHLFVIIMMVIILPGMLPRQGTIFGFAGGTGEPNDPYQIALPADLTVIGSDPNLQDKHFILMTDIDLYGLSWSTAVIPEFSGVFDGNDLSIQNLTITGDANLGLFGTLAPGAEIRHLGIEYVNVSVTDTNNVTPPGQGRIAALTGLNQGHISRCYSTGNISGNTNIGGLVGENDLGNVSHCYSTCRVSGQENVGGLVGYNQPFSVIQSCYSTGLIQGESNAAGLVGLNQGMVLNSYSKGTVHTTQHGGGLVGENNNGSIANCYSTGNITGYEGLGGLVGTGLGTVSRSFWNIQTSRQSTSQGGDGLYTEEMTERHTYSEAGWDFVDEISNGTSQIWHMPESGGYPLLGALDGNEPNQPQGQGTPEDPYLITDTWELGAVYYRPWACYTLAAPLDLSEIEWSTAVIPIFFGSFDGHSQTIRHLNMAGGSDLGLFGTLVHDTQVTNLLVVDINVVGTGERIGGLVGSIQSGTVNACYCAGIVSGRDRSGGLVGLNNGATSYSNGDVNVSGRYQVGGLVGSNSNTIRQCYSTGTVTGSEYTGGLVGISSGRLEHCYTTGTVSGDHFVGGLAGHHSGDIYDCYSTSTVFGNISIGGLVGSNSGCLDNSFCTGAVTGNTDTGGLIGNNSGSINQCYSHSNITGLFFAGGLVGFNQSPNEVNNCYSRGTVSGESWVGGLIGKNTGPIRNCYSTGKVSGTTDVGGLVGSNQTNSILYSFWDRDTSGRPTSDGGVWRTTLQMKDITTYLNAGWDFVDETDNGMEDIWVMPINDYPKFSWNDGILRLAPLW